MNETIPTPSAGKSVIQAIGTAFNVHRRSSGETTVSVIEGKVQISGDGISPILETPKLTAGEQARITARGHIERQKSVDAAAVTAWRERRLVFHRATLAEIAEEFNRYNDSPRLSIEDGTLRQRRYTVALPADDPESLLDYLRRDAGIALETHDGKVHIRRAR